MTGLNRDVTISQYNTKDGGLEGGFTVDTATVNMIEHPVDTVVNTITAVDKGYDEAAKTTGKIVDEAGVVVEKTGNLIEYDHFTTDGKVQYYVNMDDYEAQKENGGEITALDTLVYVKSKSAAGEELTGSDMSNLRLSSGIVLDGATDAIKENLESNIRVNSREEVLASLAVLDKYDSGDASEARSYLSGVIAEDNYKVQLATNSGLRDGELGQYPQTQVIYEEQNTRENITLKSAINGDFGADYGRAAGQNFQNGEYVMGAVNLTSGTCEAGYDMLAINGAAKVVGTGVEVVSYLTSIEGRITAGMTVELIKQNGVTNVASNAAWEYAGVNAVTNANYVGIGVAEGSWSISAYPTGAYTVNTAYNLGWVTGWNIANHNEITGGASYVVEKLENKFNNESNK